MGGGFFDLRLVTDSLVLEEIIFHCWCSSLGLSLSLLFEGYDMVWPKQKNLPLPVITCWKSSGWNHGVELFGPSRKTVSSQAPTPLQKDQPPMFFLKLFPFRNPNNKAINKKKLSTKNRHEPNRTTLIEERYILVHPRKHGTWKWNPFDQGSLNEPFWGNQTIDTYGNFAGFPL